MALTAGTTCTSCSARAACVAARPAQFLRAYLEEPARRRDDLSDDGGASREAAELDEVQAETYAADPPLDGTVLHYGVGRDPPVPGRRLRRRCTPLAAQRWERSSWSAKTGQPRPCVFDPRQARARAISAASE